MGTIIGPIEEKEGYDKNYSAAVNIATAPTGLLIPPSNVLITFSLVSGGTSVAALFMAGYIPGILWGLFCMIVAFFIARKYNYRSTLQLKRDFRLYGRLFLVYFLLSLLLVVLLRAYLRLQKVQ